MKYLTDVGNRRIKGYLPLKEKIGNYSQVEICVYYSLGGANYFSGNTNPRGYKVSITPCEVSKGMVSYTLLGGERESGGYVAIEGAARFKAKRLAELAELIDPNVPDIVEAFAANDKAKLIVLCRLGKAVEAVRNERPVPTFQKSRMQILTEEIKASLPKLYATQDKKAEEVRIAIKFFDPTGSWTWYATEGGQLVI